MNAILRSRSPLHGGGLLNGPSTASESACCADLAASRAEHGLATLDGARVKCREGPARHVTATEMQH
jgi:hypothetical protein